MDQPERTFAQWEEEAPLYFRQDPLWRMKTYRLAIFAGEPVAGDAQRIRRAPGGYPIADQLPHAVNSIAANLSEGYSRSSGRDRVRFFEYALGSVREAIVWYHASVHLLPPETIATRQDVLIEIRALLLAIIPRERRRRIDS
jgi:four helix bundle protein